MPTINMRQLRDTKRLKAWLRHGKVVELRERERVIARIVPEGTPLPANGWPDFAAMRKAILGGRVVPGADLLVKERGRY